MSDLTIQGQVVVKEERPLLIVEKNVLVVEKNGSGGGGEALIIQNLGTLTAATMIDAAASVVAEFTLGATVALSLKSSAASGTAQYLILHINNGNAYGIVWPDSVVWDGASTPTLSKEDIIVMYTENAGATWFARRTWTSNVRGSGTTDIWDGQVGTVPTPVDNVYTINKCSELAAVAAAVNAGTLSTSGKMFLLNANLDLNSYEWTPIGNSSYPFVGNIDGKNHIINNMKITSRSDGSGFINYANDSTVSNLTIYCQIHATSGNAGGLIAHTSTIGDHANKIEDIHIIGDISSYLSSNQDMAGVVARSAYVSNSSFVGTITNKNSISYSDWTHIGGITAENDQNAINCICLATIDLGNPSGSYMCAGGITGHADNVETLNNCFVGKIKNTNNIIKVGGIAGDTSGTVKRLSNNCSLIIDSSVNGLYGVSTATLNVTNNFTFGGTAQSGCTLVASESELPVSTILLNKYANDSGVFNAIATAYPKESSQAGTVEITPTSGLTVTPKEIANDTETALTTTGSGTLTFAVPASVLASATYNANASVDMSVTEV